MTGLRRILMILLMLLAIGGVMAMSGCDDQGPAEEAGEEIDDAVDDATDAFDD